MSTKVTIKYQAAQSGSVGFHLYDDVLDEFGPERADPPVYLSLRGVGVQLETLGEGGAEVTVTLPRAVARVLGLLPLASSHQTEVK